MRDRRSDFDVTNTVQVSNPTEVCEAVRAIWSHHFDRSGFAPIETGFRKLEAAFVGRAPGLHGIETTYHDLQHTLDVTLAMARLLDGHAREHGASELGEERWAVGLITALFHDAGYLRKLRDTQHQHGAEYTRVHVSRSADMLAEILPELGFGNASKVAAEMVHFTGYERPFDDIEIDDPAWIKTGHLLGTADMLAQMADRCYLEKCRDRLYAEFEMGGMARMRAPDGRIIVNYSSPKDLLKKTPGFCQVTLEKRLGGQFDKAHRYLDVHFGGTNLYLQEIRANLAHLSHVIEEGRWDLLRRKPPCFNIDHFSRNQTRH